MNIDYAKIMEEDGQFSAYVSEFMRMYVTLPESREMLRMLHMNYQIGISAPQTFQIIRHLRPDRDIHDDPYQ